SVTINMHTARFPILALHIVIKQDLLQISLFVKPLYTEHFRDAVKSKVLFAAQMKQNCKNRSTIFTILRVRRMTLTK
ncbi:MAG: hypothetical protein ACKO7R_00060, partial [Pseudanabaena sp.]